MNRRGALAKTTSLFLAVLMFAMVVPVQSVLAAMVDTETLLTPGSSDTGRARITAFLDREDVKAVLTARGIDPREAKSRVASLSDAEVQRIVDRMDQLPAGGDALGLILGAALVIFLILLITDILGLTDIFPFVKKHR
jgi:Family of unknown function (DUF6627)